MEKMIVRRQSANKTRTAIIKAAFKIFAQSGFSGTTTLAIAKAAKVNETLIFHHFENKSELWRQVKAAVINSIPIEPLDLKPTSLRNFLTAIFKQRLHAYQQNPELIRLLQWQRLESNHDLAAGNILAPNHWILPIEHLQQIKQIRADIRPELIMIWLQASINALLFENQPLLQTQTAQQEYLDGLLRGFESALK